MADSGLCEAQSRVGCTSPVESGTLSLQGRRPLRWPFRRVMHGAARWEALSHPGDQHGERYHSQVGAGGSGQSSEIVTREGRKWQSWWLLLFGPASHSPLLSLAGAVVRVARGAPGRKEALVAAQTSCVTFLTTPHFTSEEIGSEGLEGDMGLAAVHSGPQRGSIFASTVLR